MSNSEERRQMKELRIAWLLARPETLDPLRLRAKQFLGISHFDAAGLCVAKQMQDAGLFSRKTYLNDIRWERYVNAAILRSEK